jgi:hypothetical protein
MVASAMNRSTDPEFFTLLTRSYARLVGEPLVPKVKDANWLYAEAPFAVLAHNTEPDPIFIYANRAAQNCFGYSWEEFLSLHSRLSAETGDQAARQALLDAVAKNGFMTGYSGVRVAKSGVRFRIEHGIVWELIDLEGVRRGQAATFSSWQRL